MCYFGCVVCEEKKCYLQRRRYPIRLAIWKKKFVSFYLRQYLLGETMSLVQSYFLVFWQNLTTQRVSLFCWKSTQGSVSYISAALLPPRCSMETYPSIFFTHLSCSGSFRPRSYHSMLRAGRRVHSEQVTMSTTVCHVDIHLSPVKPKTKLR